jgi:hypothetical protein
MSRNVRSIAFALLLVLVSASAAQALPLGETPGSNLISQMWNWFGTLLSPGLTSVWDMEGSSMDPNGVPQNNNWSAPTTDEGSQMDPNG